MKVLTRLAGAIALASSLSFGLTSGAFAQYPDRSITIIVPFAAGGTTDVVARIMSEPMSRILKQQVLVENVTGAGGIVGVTRAKNATPDGCTLLMGNLGTQAASVGLYPKLAYDPRTDFEPIMNTGGTPMLVVAKKDLPVKDFKEFMAYLKANAANDELLAPAASARPRISPACSSIDCSAYSRHMRHSADPDRRSMHCLVDRWIMSAIRPSASCRPSRPEL